jgi:hypothetical protein
VDASCQALCCRKVGRKCGGGWAVCAGQYLEWYAKNKKLKKWRVQA